MSRACRKHLLSAIVVSCVIQFTAHSMAAMTLAAQSTSTKAPPVTDSLHLKPGLFGLKYTIGQGRAEYAVDPWFGVSMKQSFTDVLGQHPEAIAEARKSSPYLTDKTFGTIGLLAGSVLFTMSASDRAEASVNGTESGAGVVSDALVYLGLPSVVMLVSDRLAKSHIDAAVDIFNEKQRISVPSENGLRLRPWLGLTRAPLPDRSAILAGISIGGW